MKEIAIIGAGPIGCYTAKLLAEKGFNVTVFEEDKKIGLPIRCTGLLSQKMSFLKIPENIILNELNKVQIHSKNNKIEIKLNRNELVICREKFDNYLYNLAKEKGVKFYLGYKFKKCENNEIIFENGFCFKYDYLIGADGPNSEIRKIINPNYVNKKTNNKFWIGVQSDVNGNFNKNEFQVYLGQEFKDFFGWEVPINNKTARVGFASYKRNKLGENKLCIKNLSGGLIPVYEPNLIVIKNNIALVGDAATHVKATTGGGLIQGLVSSKEIVEKLSKGNYNTLYNKDLKIHKVFYIHLILRKIFNQFSDKDYDYLLKLCNKEKIKKIIGKSNRENPKKMILNIIYNEPRFLKYLVKIRLKDFL
ncbi:MAG: FAD-dependent monooxygenase [Candidatus Woesearchaeota archaeon]